MQLVVMPKIKKCDRAQALLTLITRQFGKITQHVATLIGVCHMLNVGESASATILAIEKWNDTGIHLVADQEYRFTTTGQWIDWTITCDANGYPSPHWVLKISERWRRVTNENWFALIGAINFNRHLQ